MGRGRAKAKQTKVARELKYSSPSTDFASLQRELANGPNISPHKSVLAEEPEERWDDGDDPYDNWRR